MRTTGRKDVLTTGQVAKICRVAPRTVSKWFDSGQLRGYRIPGSRDRRIPLQHLVAFMRAHGIPLDGLDQGRCRVMILAARVPAELAEALNASDRYEVRTARNGFQAGMIAQQFHPHVVVVDAGSDEDEAVDVCRHIKAAAELQAATVLAAVDEPTEQRLRRLTLRGFDGCLAKPLSAGRVAAAAEEATNLIT
jgi:excisionase family DNA binding protein